MASHPIHMQPTLQCSLLVTLCGVLLGKAEVLTGPFRNTACEEFFYKGIEPSDGLVPTNPARICQVYNNKYHYATMYDRDKRIPIYSAYIYQPGTGPRSKEWFIEPQLADQSLTKALEKEFDTKIPKSQLMRSQAVSTDYRPTSKYYDKGHLNPSLHHNTVESKMATFTLTNVVPQYNKLNQGEWKRYEEKTMARNSTGCKETYVLVGSVPGNQYVSKERVNVPSHMWAAACCTLSTGGVKSWTAFAENNKNEVVKHMTIGELETTLAKLFNRGIALFHPDCQQMPANRNN